MFSRNTIKLSYSCMANVRTIISNHKKAKINKSVRTNDQKKNCNCRNPNSCPMDENCNVENVIYQAEVTTPATKETYTRLCDTTLKLRFRNHLCSFRNKRYKHATGLSKYIWSLKDQKIAYEIKWRQVKKKKLGPIRMYLRDVICVCGIIFSYYAGRKCQLSTAEMNSHRVIHMLGNFY